MQNGDSYAGLWHPRIHKRCPSHKKNCRKKISQRWDTGLKWDKMSLDCPYVSGIFTFIPLMSYSLHIKPMGHGSIGLLPGWF